MESRPEASAHKDSERVVLRRQPHFKSDAGKVHLITEQPAKVWKEGERGNSPSRK